MTWAIWVVFVYNALSITKDTIKFMEKDDTASRRLATLFAFVLRTSFLFIAGWELIHI